MWKWFVLAMTLVACSGGGDELEAPMLGDCTKCNTAPSSGGGSSGGGSNDASSGFDGGTFDAANDAIDIVDVGVSSDAANASDAIDIVDVGVPNDI